MSSHWCVWCKEHLNTWDQLNVASSVELWTLEHMVKHRHKIIREKIKDPKEICGIVDFPVWDFIEPLNYIIPQLHIEIGLINYILEKFYDFIEEQIKVAPPKEQMALNSMILSDVARIKAKERLDEWHDIFNVDLAMQCYSKSELLKALRAKNLMEAEHASLQQQQRDLEESIKALVNRRKELESDVTMERKALAGARAKFKDVQAKKPK